MPPGLTLFAGGVAGDLEHQQEVLIEGAASLRDFHVDETPVLRPARRDHHMVDRVRQVPEEPLEGSRVGGVEGCGAEGVEFPRCLLKALGIPSGDDHVGPLSACSSGCFEPDAGAAADDDDGLSEELRFTPNGKGSGCGAHDSSR